MSLQNTNAMIPKIYLFFISLILMTVMLADTFFPPLGAVFCAFLAYYWVSRGLQSWLVRMAEKFRKAPMRYPVYRRRKIVTFSNGYLLPWVLMLYRTICKSNKVTSMPENLNDSSEIERASNNKPVEDSVDFTFSKCHCSKRKEPLASDEFKTFVSNISEHHIKSWYHYLSENEEFPKEIEEVLEDSFAAALYRVSRLNLNQLANQLLIITFNHLYNFNHNRRTSRKSRTNTDAKGFVSILTHPAMKDKKSEKIYISSVCEILVDMVVPPKLLHCSLSRATITDILTRQILVPLVNLLSDPCWVTWAIAFLLEGSNSIDYSPQSQDSKDIGTSSNETIEVTPNVDSRPNGTAKKPSPNQLNKTKSFSFDSLDDLGKGNLTKIQQKDLGRSIGLIFTPKDETCASMLRRESILTTAPAKSANHRRLSTDDSSPDFKALPPYSLYPVLRPKAYKNLSNCKSVPSPVFNRLPKKSSTLNKLKCSFSLDAISSQAASGLDSVQQNVFQNSPSAQNLRVFENDPSTSGENKPLSRKSSLLPPTPDVEEAEEVTEIMNLEPFQNVRIIGTKEQLDPRNKIYILYSIKYEYLKSEENEDGYVEFIEKTGFAERRFKEFIALQSKLEQPDLKKYMKGIEGPSKWLSMTISPKDKRNIEKRRVFLEKYLQSLCKRDGVKNNPDLHEFMGFKGDPRIAFVKNASDFPVQRILAKMMGSAFDLIKTALPIVPDGLESGDISPSSLSDKSPNTSRSILPSFGAKMKTKTKVSAVVCHCKRPSNLDEEIRVYLGGSLENSRSHSPDSLNQMMEPNGGNSHCDLYGEGQPAWKRKAAELRDPPIGPRMRGDGCDSFEPKSIEDNTNEFTHIKFQNLQRTFQYDIPLANTLIDIALIVLFPTHSLSDDYATVTLKVIFGDLVQAWIQKQLNHLTKSEPWALCLHSLHETLWPSQYREANERKDLEHCKLAALEALKSKFPVLIRRLIGEEQLRMNLDTFLASLLNQTYNRNLLYQIIDVIIEMLCAQELQNPQ